MIIPEVYVERDPYSYLVKIWSDKVSSLALHCMQQKVIDYFRGEAINQDTISALFGQRRTK